MPAPAPSSAAVRDPAAARPGLGLLLLLGAMTAFGAMSIDLYLPSLPTLGTNLHASPGAVGATMSAFLGGLAVGQLVIGPVSDRHGRRRPLIAGLLLYIVASVVCARAPQIEVLVIGRFLQGLGGCAALVINRAVVSDRFAHTETARIFSMLTLVLGVAPVLAPLGGSALLAAHGWRAIFVVLTGFGIAVLAATALALPETRGPADRAAARAASPLGVYARLLTSRVLVGHLIALALSGACLLVYVASSPSLFIGDFGMTPRAFSLLFAGNAVAFIGASQLNRLALARHTPARIARTGLRAAMAVGIVFAAVAWAGGAGLWVSCGFVFATLASYGFIQSNLAADALALDPGNAGSIAAISGTATFGAGALAATIATAFHDGTSRPGASVIALCCAGAWWGYRTLMQRA